MRRMAAARMLRLGLVLVLVLGLVLGLDAGRTKVNKHKPWIETSYHGVITENTELVLLDPPLVALDKDAPVPFAGEICGFAVLGGAEAPFEAVVLNGTSGEGQLRARRLVDCEAQKEYTFIIQAHDCGSGAGGSGAKKSHKAVVHIQVDDVNEFAPVFREPQYRASVIEGKIYDSILQVEATDQDCSPQYSQICNYQISTSGSPFAIDRNGNMRNTEKLSYDRQQFYQVQVTAWDCGQKRALHSVPVHIQVQPQCRPGWRGWSKRVDYEPGTGSKQLFPNMHLETCGGPLSAVRTTVELQTSHISKGCDRETYSEKSLQKLCGASSGSTELLPAPSAATNWTSWLLTDGGRDELVFRFEGRQAAKVPDSVVPQNLTDRFTIATWMKHGPSPGLRAEKETLLCNSDKTEMNRHHYSLYVHNCRLVFLLRTDFSRAESFRPAEFHWKLEQICDKEWHYYVLNVDFPRASLFVDGVSFEPYLVTDDWPIHPSQIDMQLTVGACWQGGEVTRPRFTQFFRGSLSGLTIRPGHIDTQKVISCLQACKEGLDIHSLEKLDQSLKFHFNPAQSVLVMEAEDLDHINAALRKVSYINSRQFPTAGIRRLSVRTSVQCFGEDSCLSIADVEAVVMVQPPSEARVTISGVERVSWPHLRAPGGVALFQDLHITSSGQKTDGQQQASPAQQHPGPAQSNASPAQHQTGPAQHHTVRRPGVVQEVVHNLDFCDVLVLGEELRPEQESLQLHTSALTGKHLDATNSTTGISIYGVDSMSNYEQVIREVRYFNLEPSLITERRFRLSCSQLNGRYTSNDFTLEVSVLHSSQSGLSEEHVNHLVAPPQYLQLVHQPSLVQDLSPNHSTGVPSAATVLIVLCIAALVVVVVLGIYRLHVTHQEDTKLNETNRDSDLRWDNTALNITINPLEKLEAPQEAEHEVTEEDEDEEDEEEDEDVTSGDSDDSEDEADVQLPTATRHNKHWHKTAASL